jgi:DNA-binding XRE family transcriptional regulator
MENKRKARLNELRRAFYEDLDEGRLTSLSDTVRRMRKSIGLTQTDYAKLVGIAPRVLIDLERGVGNPTLKTLEKIAAPFGLCIALARKS